MIPIIVVVKLNGELGNSFAVKILDKYPQDARNPIGSAPMEAGSIPVTTTHNAGHLSGTP